MRYILLDGQLIEIKVQTKNLEHFLEKGYNVKINDIIQVPPSDLTKKSKKIEKRKCDCCGTIYEREHCFNEKTHECRGEDVCPSCLKLPLYKNKVLEKMYETIYKKYGVRSLGVGIKEVQEKQKKTMVEKYGVEFPGNIQGSEEKRIKTNLERYGCENPAQNEEIKKKIRKTLYDNNTCPTSSQQIKIKNIIEEAGIGRAELNFPVSNTQLDIAIFCDDLLKIDVEYDGSFWHQDQQKDRRRDEFLKKEGYKILRIKSGHKTPSKEELIQSLNKLIKEDCSYTEIVLKDWNNNF